MTAPDVVGQAALLLSDLLAGCDALPEYRASGALRLVIARALGSVDLPRFRSLDEFRTALRRFDTEDVREVTRALFAAWERASVTSAFKAAPRADLTISDVRRARRATGLSLGYLATVAEVPSRRLRELEWGYMRDWPATAEARAQVIRYARAAGLDESIVLSIAWPMILDNAAHGEPAAASTSTALVPSGPQVIAVASVAASRRQRWRGPLIAAAATIALLGAFAFGSRSSARTPPPPDTVHVGVGGDRALPPPSTDQAPAPQRTLRGQPVATTGDSDSEPPRAARATVTPVRVEPAPAAAPQKPKRRRAAAARPPEREEPRKSVFQRELFRIVIR